MDAITLPLQKRALQVAARAAMVHAAPRADQFARDRTVAAREPDCNMNTREAMCLRLES